jgi:small conductance mechanosensitive channel
MEASPSHLVAAATNAWDVLTALAVAYSFSAIGAIVILVVGWIAAGLAERWIYAAMGAFKHIDETIKRFFSKALRYVVLIFVGVTVLSQFGVQTTSIVAALGAAGLAIGLALQGTLQNIAAGLMLLFLRPFRVGEYIETTNVAGTIREIGLFATELRMADGVFVLAPNSTLWNTPIKNFSRNGSRRNDLSVKVANDTDLDIAQAVLRSVLDADSRVVSDPAPTIFVAGFNEAGPTLTARYWATADNFLATKFDLTRDLEAALRSKGIVVK